MMASTVKNGIDRLRNGNQRRRPLISINLSSGEFCPILAWFSASGHTVRNIHQINIDGYSTGNERLD